MKHTPGPWEARKFNDTKSTSIYAAGINHSIASVKNNNDARLIAAAPDLLEACKTMIEFLKRPMNLRAEQDLKDIILNMNTAIKKAEGKE